MALSTWLRGLAAALLALAILPVTLTSRVGDEASAGLLSTPPLRRPVALALADDGQWLFVANQAGTISTIDTEKLRVASEMRAGRKLSDLAIFPDDRFLVALDEDSNNAIFLKRKAAKLKQIAKLAVAPYPVSVTVSADGKRCYVASLWPRRLTEIELGSELRSGRAPSISRTIKLPFAPRNQVLVRGDKKLVVADSFGAKLAIVDTAAGKLERVHELPGHHIRGLGVTPDGGRLLVSQQVLHPRATTAFEDIHWGNLVTNNVRSLDLDALVRPGGDPLQGSRSLALGEVGKGAADPGGLMMASDGTILVALSGVNEVIIGRERETTWTRRAVGRRPTAVLPGHNSSRVYVANTLSDSVSVVDLKKQVVLEEIQLGSEPPPLTEAERGEVLFYSARLTHDGWFSCNSCHIDGHTSGLLNDNLTDGSFGTPKRILTLRGVADTAPYAWNGSMPDLESQIRKSIKTTMQGPDLTEKEVRDIAAFLRSLPPPPAAGCFEPSRDQAVLEHGRKIFKGQGCVLCHTPPTYTSSKSYDVGMVDEVSNRYFNPPSLRGVSQGGPYFHDGRARTLEDVFVVFGHELKQPLARDDVQALVAFLRSI
jgi:YVTN family beta-propeller protein